MNIPTISMRIQDLDVIIEQAVTRVINEIDPVVGKFQNIADQLVVSIETRTRQHVSTIFSSFCINLFVVLVVIVLGLILLMVLIRLLDTLLQNFAFELSTRKFIALLLFTSFFLWLFFAMLVATFLPDQLIDAQTLKYGLFSLLSVICALLLFVWFRSLCVHRVYIKQVLLHELFDFRPSGNRVTPSQLRNKPVNYFPMSPARAETIPSEY